MENEHIKKGAFGWMVFVPQSNEYRRCSRILIKNGEVSAELAISQEEGDGIDTCVMLYPPSSKFPPDKTVELNDQTFSVFDGSDLHKTYDTAMLAYAHYAYAIFTGTSKFTPVLNKTLEADIERAMRNLEEGTVETEAGKKKLNDLRFAHEWARVLAIAGTEIERSDRRLEQEIGAQIMEDTIMMDDDFLPNDY